MVNLKEYRELIIGILSITYSIDCCQPKFSPVVGILQFLYVIMLQNFNVIKHRKYFNLLRHWVSSMGYKQRPKSQQFLQLSKL